MLDGDLPPAHETYRQRVLLLRCFHPIDGTGLQRPNFVIEGGVRVQNIGVLDAGALVDLAAAPTPAFAPLAAVLQGLDSQLAADPTDDPRNWFAVLTDRRGDFSTYTLRLVAGIGDDAQPADFDPILREVRFAFKVECPSDFDCVDDDVDEQTVPASPTIDYLAKDYASFRQLMLDRMSVTLEDWVERSPADLGVALVEVLAYAADHLSYYQDAVGTEAYLATARTRPSVRRHARLLDYQMHEGCNARAWVQIQLADGEVLQTGGDGVPLVPLGTPILARVPHKARQPVLTEVEADDLPFGLRLQFETKHDVHLLAAGSTLR